jgi:16S rRNA (uracil1498-N3)-methyltransferase
MHRFFIPPEWIKNKRVVFNGEIARQMKNVLRIGVGEKVEVLDNLGKEYLVEIELSKDNPTGKIIEEKENESEPDVHLTLLFGLTQREKVEWILQKATEIGASQFVPLVTERSLIRGVGIVQSKLNRWRSILKEAAEQSGRGLIPDLENPVDFSQGLDYAKEIDLALFAWEGEEKEGLRKIMIEGQYRKIGLMIGPEGGFSEQEQQQAIKQGWRSITLGKRILRMETAALVGCALIIHTFEEG